MPLRRACRAIWGSGILAGQLESGKASLLYATSHIALQTPVASESRLPSTSSGATELTKIPNACAMDYRYCSAISVTHGSPSSQSAAFKAISASSAFSLLCRISTSFSKQYRGSIVFLISCRLDTALAVIAATTAGPRVFQYF